MQEGKPEKYSGGSVSQMNKEIYLSSPNKDVITLYIRPDTPLQNVMDLLKKEEPIINNIKSRVTRQGIQAAFTRLKTFLSTLPASEFGYIICCTPDQLVYINDITVTVDKYYCGGEFYSVPLEEVLALRLNPIGIITLDTKEATIAYIGDKIEILQHMTSGIPGKHGKGGQSEQRFTRKRQEEVKHFLRRIGEASKLYLSAYPITQLIIAGCGQTKDKFYKDKKTLDPRLKEKVLAVYDIQYTGEEGIREALHKALPQLEKNAFAQEVKVVEDFFELLGKQFHCVVYGEKEIEQEMHLIKRLIKIEEHTKEYPKETIVLHFQGEHYLKIKNLGGVVGIKC